MQNQWFRVNAVTRYQDIPAVKDIRPRSVTVMASLVGLFLLSLTLLILGVMAVARTGPIPSILDVPQSYWPGNLPPEGMSCDNNAVSVPRCFVEFQGHTVYFDFDLDARLIIRAMIPVETYSIGQLINSWGIPSGIHWNYYTIYVYWPTRWVILDNDSFRPDSHVQSIWYTPEQPPGSPWAGFRYDAG